VAWRDSPVDVFLAVTTALGMTAPVASVNVPAIDPYRTCADRSASPRTIMAIATMLVVRRILFASFTVRLQS
jgi:hypothetical protein